jgi:hypothetical protein
MDKHAQRWRAYRFWNRVGIFALFALLPVVAFSAFLTRASSDSSAVPYLVGARGRKCVHCALALD